VLASGPPTVASGSSPAKVCPWLKTLGNSHLFNDALGIPQRPTGKEYVIDMLGPGLAAEVATVKKNFSLAYQYPPRFLFMCYLFFSEAVVFCTSFFL